VIEGLAVGVIRSIGVLLSATHRLI
jgi:hypothetical protein